MSPFPDEVVELFHNQGLRYQGNNARLGQKKVIFRSKIDAVLGQELGMFFTKIDAGFRQVLLYGKLGARFCQKFNALVVVWQDRDASKNQYYTCYS